MTRRKSDILTKKNKLHKKNNTKQGVTQDYPSSYIVWLKKKGIQITSNLF